jgi:hypothetical protein
MKYLWVAIRKIKFLKYFENQNYNLLIIDIYHEKNERITV